MKKDIRTILTAPEKKKRENILTEPLKKSSMKTAGDMAPMYQPTPKYRPGQRKKT